MQNYPQRAKGVDTFKLNKEIAYKGSIGQKRKDFCTDYIEKKREILEGFQAVQIQTTANNGETITCQKGCTYCCLYYLQATVQECEAIVYHLYHNEIALSTFLGNYTDWREKLRQNGDIFKKCAQLEKEMTRYEKQNIPCPFLHNNLCLVYDVRPFTCAGLVATTPPEWCNPLNPNKPKLYKTLNPAATFDTSFYYKRISVTVLTFAPLAVYGILEYGYKLLSNIPGLEDLEEAAMKEPQIRAITERFS